MDIPTREQLMTLSAASSSEEPWQIFDDALLARARNVACPQNARGFSETTVVFQPGGSWLGRFWNVTLAGASDCREDTVLW